MTPKQFKEARRRLGLTAAELASLLGVHVRTVQSWEKETGTKSRWPNPIASTVLGWFIGGFRPEGWPK